MATILLSDPPDQPPRSSVERSDLDLKSPAFIEFSERLRRVQDAIEVARLQVGPGVSPRLVAVSKVQPVEALLQARAAGVADFGENYAQEMVDKQAALASIPDFANVTWHFIGKLQRNKVKMVVGKSLIHTVDRLELLREIERRAALLNLQQSCLVEVNWGEAQKAGIEADAVKTLLDGFSSCHHVRCVGLMTIPPVDEPSQSRRYFAKLRALRDQLDGEQRPRVELRELSMGMSSDYVEAVLEGATIVRVGSAIFGSRPVRS